MKLAKSNNSFQLAPEETMQAVLVDVVDMGMQPDRFTEGELIHQVRLVFQTEEETDEGVPFLVSTFPTRASINSKAKLYGYITSILGRTLEEGDFDEEGEIDLDELLIGENANVTVTHRTSGENTYANVTAIGALNSKQKKAALLAPRNYIRQKDRDAFNPEQIEKEAEAASAAAGNKM